MNMILSKAQMSKSAQPGEFLGRVLGPLRKSGFSLMKTLLKQIARSIFIPLGLTAAASAKDAAIQKKFLDLVYASRYISF